MYMRQLLPAALWAARFASPARAGCWRDTKCDGPENPSFQGKWEDNHFAPESRELAPVQVLSKDHERVSDWPAPTRLAQNGTLLIFDWGFEVGGVVSIQYSSTGSGTLGISFSEASNFTGYNSDESNGGTGPDGALYTVVGPDNDDGDETYSVPDDRARGGFRYMSLYTLTNSSLEIDVKRVTVELSFHPNWGNMRAYGGYFHSSDETLNKIWYASAYTIQTNIMATNTARVYPCLNTGWENNADLFTNGPGLAAGNKRDRAVWAGDFAMAIRSAAVALGDMGTLKRSLQLQFDVQQTTGELPWVPPPINIFGSDTYHMATLLATYDYVLYSGDLQWLREYWERYKLAMSFVTNKIDSSNMINITGANNWGRTAISSGYTTDGNMLLYGSLTTGSILSRWMNDEIGSHWTDLAVSLKEAVVMSNWDAEAGAFWNSADDRSNHCEDGNSLALYYNGTDSSHSQSISEYLPSQWTAIGAETGELPGSVVMFVEGYEVKGHFAVSQAQRALDLIRLSWGWNLDNPYGTQSTFAEGYKTDGSWRYRDDSYSKMGSYTAHALAWSTGPVDALVSYIVGLRPTGPGGLDWLLEPQLGDLSSAQGGFTSPLGKFSSGWELNATSFELWLDVPQNTSGKIVMPDISGRLTVDGNALPQEQQGVNRRRTLEMGGGQHTVKITSMARI